MSNIRWRAVLAGGIVAISLNFLVGELLLYVPLLLDTLLRRPEEAITGGYSSEFPGMAEIRPILVALSANLMGGFFAGRLSSTHPGLNGALAALVNALFGFAGLGLAAVYVHNQPGQIRSENAGVLAVVIVAAAVLLPLAVLCAFLGGRLGGYFRTRRAS